MERTSEKNRTDLGLKQTGRKCVKHFDLIHVTKIMNTYKFLAFHSPLTHHLVLLNLWGGICWSVCLMMCMVGRHGRKEWDWSRRARASLRTNTGKLFGVRESKLKGEGLCVALLWSTESNRISAWVRELHLKPWSNFGRDICLLDWIFSTVSCQEAASCEQPLAKSSIQITLLSLVSFLCISPHKFYLQFCGMY